MPERVLEEEQGDVFCSWDGHETRSGRHGAGAGWAMNVGISSPGIRTETPQEYTLICKSRIPDELMEHHLMRNIRRLFGLKIHKVDEFMQHHLMSNIRRLLKA